MSDALSAVARWSGEMTTRDPRALQRIGEAARQDRPGVWLRCLYGTIEDKQPDVAVVTGIRYPNEAAMIREMGGALVRVERYEADGSLYICPHRDPNHVSESFAATLEVDAVIRARSGDTDGIKRQVHIAARLV